MSLNTDFGVLSNEDHLGKWCRDFSYLMHYDWLAKPNGAIARDRLANCLSTVPSLCKDKDYMEAYYEYSEKRCLWLPRLIVECLIHGHSQWDISNSHDSFHDLSSALYVLQDNTIPEGLRAVMARIIGIQHTLREAMKGNVNEAYVSDNNKRVAVNAHQTLVDLIASCEASDNNKKVAVIAVQFLARALEARSGGAALKAKMLASADNFTHPKHLISIEYGNTFKEAIAHAYPLCAEPKLYFLSATGDLGTDTDKRELVGGLGEEKETILSELYGNTVKTFISRPDENVTITLRERINGRINKRPLKTFNGKDYVALSLIQQILLDLYRQQPENFCALQVEYKPLQPVQDILIGFTLHLPKPNVILQNSEQTLDSAVTESIKSSEWLRLELILVRYASARVTNLRMQVGPGELAINAIDEDGVQWKSAMQQVWEHNQERTFDAYLDQVSGHQTMQEAIRPPLCKQKGDWYVCADIGGTSVKGVFGNFKAGKEYPFSFATAPQGGEVYREVDLFVERFAQAFYTETGQTVESIRFRYMVLGWPGAVYKAYTESATPSGYSGILRLFGLSPSIVENTAPLIRNLRLREAFEKRFNCSVLLGNDGDQHTIAPAQLVKTSMHYRRLLVCAVGTGLGGGIIVEGDKLPLPILSEFGKCIVNIACPFPTQGNFPEGHANSLLSSNTVAHLAKTMDWTDGPTTPLELAFALSTSSSHEEYPDIEQLMRSEIEDKMRPLGVFSTPPYVNTMHDMRKKQLSGTTTDAKTEKLVEDYAQIIADITSMLHKDLICDALALTGGPMQGTMGALLVETVKDYMQKYYAIKPRGSEAKSIKPNEIHLFQSNAATPSAMHKFAEDFLP